MTDNTELTAAEQRSAEKAAAKEVAREAAKQKIETSTGTEGEDDPKKRQWHGWDEIQLYAHMLDLGVEGFEEAIDAKADHPVPEEKVYGLLALERNGRNRTPYVKAAMKRLDLKADELPGGGPAYTNDVTNITQL